MEQKEAVLTPINLLTTLDKYSPVKKIYEFLKLNQIPSYLFGSCTWRLPFNSQENHDFDIMIKHDYIDVFNKFITTSEDNVYYLADSKKLVQYGEKIHYELTIETLHCDIIFTENLNQFKTHMSDIDNGMLLYNILEDKYETIEPLTVDYIENLCINNKIATKYINNKKCAKPSFNFNRFNKYLTYGFTYDADLIAPVVGNYFLNQFWTKQFDKNRMTVRKQIFSEKCINRTCYDFVMKCIDFIVCDSERINNKIHNYIVIFALEMQDYKVAELYLHKITKLEKITAKYLSYFGLNNNQFFTFIDIIDKTLSSIEHRYLYSKFDISIELLEHGDYVRYLQLIKHNKSYSIDEIVQHFV